MCDFIAGFIAGGLGAVVLRVLIDATSKIIYKVLHKDQPDPSLSCLKIPDDCPKTALDFIIDLECPDGGVVRVAVPSDADSYEGRCSRTYHELDRPVGLNLVCPGHYT